MPFQMDVAIEREGVVKTNQSLVSKGVFLRACFVRVWYILVPYSHRVLGRKPGSTHQAAKWCERERLRLLPLPDLFNSYELADTCTQKYKYIRRRAVRI